jgi:hypothetical protein
LKARVLELEAELAAANSREVGMAECYDLGVRNMIGSVRTVDGAVHAVSGVSIGAAAAEGVTTTVKSLGTAIGHASKLHEHEAVAPHFKSAVELWEPFRVAMFNLFRSLVVGLEPSWEPHASATADAMVVTTVICAVVGTVNAFLSVAATLCCGDGKKSRKGGSTKTRMNKARK